MPTVIPPLSFRQGMISLDVLCIGFLVREDGVLKEAHSTSTLIRADGRCIVVDPSTPYMWPAIRTSFKQIGVFPKDVDTVIFTHSHSDHTGNLGRFRNAKVYIHSGSNAVIPGAAVVEDEEFEVCPGVRMVHTPGHCPEECSVFVDGDVHYVIAGDTVPLEGNLTERKAPTISTDPARALESIDRISEWADVVVPGHGRPFPVRRRHTFKRDADYRWISRRIPWNRERCRTR